VDAGILASAFGLGAALGLLPGPVQFILLSESTRGGLRRGFTAMAGANGTFGVEILVVAAGLSAFEPHPAALRGLRIAGGLFLLFLATDALRETVRTWNAGDAAAPSGGRAGRRDATPLAKGVFAVLLNPAAWVFLATTASALFATAAQRGGRALAVTSAVAMLAGVAAVDGTMVLVGGGVRRFRALTRWLAPALAVGLAAFGVLLLVEGIRG
jgi:threonine/homoserine/homoserine lactone efflux protein